MTTNPERDPAERQRIVDALDQANHSLRMEGIVVDPAKVPERAAVIEGTIGIDEAVRAVIARHLGT